MTDIPIPADSDLSDAEAEELMLLCGHAPGPEPLSPAAQAVLHAAYALPLKNHQPSIAAALRAAASQLTSAKAIDRLRAIADELDGA